MSDAHTAAIWDVLVQECGAYPDGVIRDSFLHHWPCGEFRFQGDLGFGGKVFTQGGKVWVSCYPEDATPARLDMMNAANKRLEALCPSDE